MSEETKRFIAVAWAIAFAVSILFVCATWSGVDQRRTALRFAEIAAEAEKAKP